MLGEPMMPDAYASLFHQVCRIASDAEYLVFPTPSGRITILSSGFGQYQDRKITADYNYDYAYDYAVRWPTSQSGNRNPFHLDRGSWGNGPDELTNQLRTNYPDMNYVWEWLDEYYQNLVTWAGQGSVGCPGSGGDPEAGRATSSGIVYYHLNGFCFHFSADLTSGPQSPLPTGGLGTGHAPATRASLVFSQPPSPLPYQRERGLIRLPRQLVRL